VRFSWRDDQDGMFAHLQRSRVGWLSVCLSLYCTPHLVFPSAAIASRLTLSQPVRRSGAGKSSKVGASILPSPFEVHSFFSFVFIPQLPPFSTYVFRRVCFLSYPFSFLFSALKCSWSVHGSRPPTLLGAFRVIRWLAVNVVHCLDLLNKMWKLN